MKAITVEPKRPESTRWEEVAEPDERDGSVLVEAIAVGVCGTDAEIVEGKYGWAPPGKTASCSVTNRSAACWTRAHRQPQAGRSGGRHRAPARPGAVPELRRGRMGHVPQRPVHRARHQGNRRLHVRALAHRARYAMKVDPVARTARRAARAGDGGDQGLGAGARSRQARLLGAAHVLVTGAGPIGLLAALVGKQFGLEVHVLDRVSRA